MTARRAPAAAVAAAHGATCRAMRNGLGTSTRTTTMSWRMRLRVIPD